MGRWQITQQEGYWANVVDALDRGVSVVTGNRRLAGAISHAFEQREIGQGLEVWVTPDVLPWSAWLQRCWEQAVVSTISDRALIGQRGVDWQEAQTA